MNKNISVIFFLSLFLASSFGAFAQKTAILEKPQKLYDDALELYKKEKYGSAVDMFEQFLELNKSEILKQNSQYYISMSKLFLENKNAPDEIDKNLELYPQNPLYQVASFQLGKYHYEHKRWSNSVKYLEKVNDESLSNDQFLEYHFMYGYDLFKTKKWEDAILHFELIKSEKTKYYYPTNFYLGYTYLELQKYDEALKYFQNCQSSKIYDTEIPLYITQIYYATKRYDDVISYTNDIQSANEISQIKYIRGETFYQKKEYKNALFLLESFKPNDKEARPVDHYMLGYSYLKTEDYEKAYPQFSKIYDTKDTLTQYAYYHNGEAYLKLGLKNNAVIAFQQASLMDFNQEIKADALYKYAKLNLEMENNAEALNALKNYVTQFPNNNNVDEVKTLQSQALLLSNNYKEAIDVLESIQNMNEETKKTYQQITFYRALQLLEENSENTTAAKGYLEKSIKYKYDREVEANCNFWLGEIAYKEKNYPKCISYSKLFLEYINAKEMPYYTSALYNIGYAYLKSENEANAADWFEQYKSKGNYYKDNAIKYVDGIERLADCYFVLRKYDRAIDNYDYVISKNSNRSDYSLFQKGMIKGLQKNYDAKISVLKKITNQFPNSIYVDDALYEIASVNYQLNKMNEALRGFQVLIEEQPNGIYAARSHLKSGQIYYQTNQYENAKAEFKYCIEHYGKDNEARQSAKYLESIYSDENNVDEYFAYMKDKGGVSFSGGYQDSITFVSAFNTYLDKKCEKGLPAFENYLQKYPKGANATEAHFYIADCNYAAKKMDAALTHYIYVLEHPKSEFVEISTRYTATIYYLKKQYAEALPYYQKLEFISTDKDNLLVSYFGQMRCNYELKNQEASISSSEKLLAFDKVTREGIIEANLYLARIYFEKNQLDKAGKSASEVINLTKNQFAAEARFIQASIEFKNANYSKSSDIIEDITKNYSSYDYWKAKALLLQSSIFKIEKDDFNARAIINLILNSYKNQDDGIIDEANKLSKELDDSAK